MDCILGSHALTLATTGERVSYALSQGSALHDYETVIQKSARVSTNQLERRFYFQQSLKPDNANHIRERHPKTPDETIQITMHFDHAGKRALMLDNDWQAQATCHSCKKAGHIGPSCAS
ncbi:hypothetical protein V7S43_011382 [Phytophthora oleae]|uniref:CCHC-type domain-containing protein n=1 Tax=Phytophthora oleae TaxID=2107226 RepID=A0ABD3FB25_9STRA